MLRVLDDDDEPDDHSWTDRTHVRQQQVDRRRAIDDDYTSFKFTHAGLI